ncbi:hypothetical protein V2J09_012810 [Rumex salicifolius]
MISLASSMAEETSQKKRVRVESQESDWPTPKKMREDLLGLLDDSDSALPGCRDSDIHDLDSVMRSFEQELSGSAAAVSPAPIDLTSDSGGSLPELGYLLEASDDELGLPSATETANGDAKGKEPEEEDLAAELVRVESESAGLGGFWPIDEGIPSYGDSLGFGVGEQQDNPGVGYPYDLNGSDYVALDGIFDYSDDGKSLRKIVSKVG